MVSHLLQSIPPEAVYLIVGVMIMVESLGIPVPGEIALVTAAVLASQHKAGLEPAWIAVAASAGAIAGDSIGFYIGHRVGKPLFGWLGGKFPRHFGPSHVVVAERFFTRRVCVSLRANLKSVSPCPRWRWSSWLCNSLSSRVSAFAPSRVS